jgi:hypothetical protein
MSRPMRIVPLLQVVTVLGLAAAGTLLAWPPDVTVAPIAPTLPALAASVPSMNTTAPALTDSIVNANIFSLTREAPEGRTFVAAMTDLPSDSMATGLYTADAGDSTSSIMADPVPHLYGVVNGPLGAAALMRLDAARKGSRLFHLGEGSGGFRVKSIGADRVELEGPTGPVVLTLAPKGDTP